MSNVDDSSATSSFEVVQDQLKDSETPESRKLHESLLAGSLSSGLGKVVADQVIFSCYNILLS